MRMLVPTTTLNVGRAAAALLLWVLLGAPDVCASTPKSGTVTSYEVSSAAFGQCRLKGIDDSSDNMKYYASLSAEDTTLTDACGRCIKVTKDATTSVTAFVLDVCTGCKAGQVKLSKDTLAQLSIDPNSNTAEVSYRFIQCPTSLLSGNIKACLMEGAGETYIPLQFYNSQKVLKSAEIMGQPATASKDSFFFSVSPQNATGKNWYQHVSVSLTSTDDETKSGEFAFSGTTGCATSSFQFSAASTADGTDETGGGPGSSSKKSSSGTTTALLAGILGGLGAIIVIVGSIFLIRRRRQSAHEEASPDVENRYHPPTPKAAPASGPERPTYPADTSLQERHPSLDRGALRDLDSPTIDFADAATPPARRRGSSGSLSPPPRDGGPHAVPPADPLHSQTLSSPSTTIESTSPHHPQDPPRSFYAAAAAPTGHYSPPTSYAPQPPPQQQQQTTPAYSYAADGSAASSSAAPPVYSYSFSKAVSPPRSSAASSFSSRGSVPTFRAPVVPSSAAGGGRSISEVTDDHDHERRSSFDIDDMRQTEERRERERQSLNSSGGSGLSGGSGQQRPPPPRAAPGGHALAPYSSESPYSSATVTSPQSYVRATSLRRGSTKESAKPREPLRFTSTQEHDSFLSGSERDSYASGGERDSYASDVQTGPHGGGSSFFGSSSPPQREDSSPMTSAYRSEPTAAAAAAPPASGGYSRGSLGILGYPYAKKTGSVRNSTSSITGTQPPTE